VAILFVGALAALLIVVGDLATLADTTVLLLLFVFVCVNAAVLVLRKDRVEHEHFRTPGVLPLLGVLACAALIVDKAFDDLTVFAYGGGLVALGIALWALNRAVGSGGTSSPAPRPG
jgi:APA family basic amino acid/polyamine antiporter